MKLVIIPGGDSSDDKALLLAPDDLTNGQIEHAVATAVNFGLATGQELPDMLAALVTQHGFVPVSEVYTTDASWVEGG